MDALQERLGRGEVIILDGATGTELERRGVPMHDGTWSAMALETHPDIVRQVHQDYIHAGADIIITNTFATARHALDRAGMGHKVRELNTRAVTLAREARDAVGLGRPIHIAGSISTGFLPASTPGAAISESAQAAAGQVKANYREQAEILAEAGVDLILLEMMSNVRHAAAAIESAVSTGLPTWVGYSCKLNHERNEVSLLHGDGETFSQALASLVPLGGSLVSIMHTEVEGTASALNAVREHWSGPLGAYPHSGNFTMPNWQFGNIISPQDFLSEAQEWVQMGVQLIGGCCGIGPEHIRRLKGGLSTHVPEKA